MNRELFSVSPAEAAKWVLDHLLTLGITAAPVLNEKAQPMGMVSATDLIQADRNTAVATCMNRPPLCVRDDVAIEEAARLLSEAGYHHLVVVDRDSRAVGMLSSLDVVRGLIGLPAGHPEGFPHYDRRTGVKWTDDIPLELDRIEAAPDGPGVFALVHGGKGVPERLVWAESVSNVRTRLLDILSSKQEYAIGFWLQQGNLRFRAASVTEMEKRRQALRATLDSLQARPQRLPQ